MSRDHTFMDREFGGHRYNSDDSGSFVRNMVFVGMPFHENMNEVYETIRDVCYSLSLEATRADDDYIGSGFIIKQISKLIEDAEFLIFDLSLERPNVYYELGYAHGVGNESEDILLIAKEGTNVHFDSAPLRVCFYTTMSSLRLLLERSLKGMIKKTRR